MVTHAQLKNMDTSKLTSAASNAGTLSQTLSQRGAEVQSSAQIPAGMWQGQDASAASEALRPLPDPLFNVSDSANRSKAVLEQLAEQLEKSKETLAEATAKAEAGGLTVADDGAVVVPPTTSLAEAETKRELAQQVQQEIERALREADEADEQAGGDLQGDKSLQEVLTELGIESAKWLGEKVSSLSGWTSRAGTLLGELANNSETRAMGKAISGKMGLLGSAAAGGLSGLDQLDHDRQHNPHLSGEQTAARAVGRGAMEGGGAALGAVAGGAAGGAVGGGAGTFVGGPGLGTGVGAAAGAIGGGMAGSHGGQRSGEFLADKMFGDIPNN